MGESDLKDSQNLASQGILDQINKKRNILIISNETVDGIVSGAILMQSIFDLLGNASVRCVNKTLLLKNKNMMEIVGESHQCYIFLDYDETVLNVIKEHNPKYDYWFINSEEITENISKNDAKIYSNISDKTLQNKVNDTHSTRTTSKKIYNLVYNFDRKIHLKIYLLLVAEISKLKVQNQIVLMDSDKDLLETATDLNLIHWLKGFSFVSRQNKSIINALEENTTHFIKDLTWNRKKIIDILRESGIEFVVENKIKSNGELDDKDYKIILEFLGRYLEDQTNSKWKTDKLKKMISSTLELSYKNNYHFTFEETNSACSGVNAFVRVLESCIRSNKFGTALSLTLGDRDEAMVEIDEFLKYEDKSIRETGQKIFSEKWRFYDDGTFVFLNGEGVFDNTGAYMFSILLGKSLTYCNRIICLRYIDTENEEIYKFIIVKGSYCDFNFSKFTNKFKELLNNDEVFPFDYFVESGMEMVTISISMKYLEVFLSKIKELIKNV